MLSMVAKNLARLLRLLEEWPKAGHRITTLAAQTAIRSHLDVLSSGNHSGSALKSAVC